MKAENLELFKKKKKKVWFSPCGWATFFFFFVKGDVGL